MLSSDTQNLLSRILLCLAEGERKVEDARKEISNEDSYDIQAIFRTLDNNGDNYITPKDIQKYLLSHELEVSLVEVKLLILFYDQDHDFALTYGEIFKIVHPGKEFPKIPRYKNDEELNVKVDMKLYNLLEKEILMVRILLALLDEIKHKRDFNIHSCFHALKYYACITGDSINIFLKNCGMRPTAGDIRAIVKRLDINKDEIIDFCEFHAFLGFPDCTFCCPCFPCGNCGAQYCENCLQDIPCYLLGCDHKGMDSKMKCTSFEHNPRIDVMTSLYDSLNSKKNLGSGGKFSSRRGKDEENEKNDYFSNSNSRGGGKNGNFYGNNNQIFPPGYNNMKNGNFYGNNRFGYGYGFNGNLSPEKFQLLQGLTNTEQLKKFLTISGILDRQNAEEINITDNLSLRLSPIRDFHPKEWGCQNCPCNFHSNPNVSCDCCSCNVCPFNSNKNTNTERQKQKQLKFPKNSIYSYSYSYEPDTSGPNKSFLSYLQNTSTNMNTPKKNVIFDKETNRYIQSRSNSSDEEENAKYMQKINILKDGLGSVNGRKYINISPKNSMIYNDEMSKKNFPNRNINLDGNDDEEQQYYDNIENNVDNVENKEEVEIRSQKIVGNKKYKEEENRNIKNINLKKSGNKKVKYFPNKDKQEMDNYDENDENEHKNNRFVPGQNQKQYQNQIRGSNINNASLNNNPNTLNNLNDLRSNNQNPNQDFNNIGENINQSNLPKSTPNFNNQENQNNPNNISPSDNKEIIDENYDFFKDFKKSPLSKTIYISNYNNNDKNKKNKNKNFVSGLMEEESEDDLTSNIYKSQEEIIDENEKLFIQYLKALIKSEREIEFAKRDLMRQEDFNAEDAFKLFEVKGSGVVTKKDLFYGLKLLGIKATNKQILIIFNKYDLDGNGFLDYDDFFDMVISFKDEDRKKEEKRKENVRVGNRNINVFSPKTRELYKKLFLVIIEEEERLEEFRQKYYFDDNLMNEIFKKINVLKDGMCNKIEFANYCLKKKICKEKKDAYLAFIRLNRNRDGGLESNEFSIELKSSVLRK